MNISRLTLIATTVLAVSACDQVPLNEDANQVIAKAVESAETMADTSEVVATVNGATITRNLFDTYSQQRQQRRPGDQDPQAVLDEIVNLELALQDGIKNGVDKQPEIVAQVTQQRRAVIASAAIKQQLIDNPITDEELKKIYDEKTSGAGTEYKARHILVEDETKAKELITKLDGGADFSDLAKEHSTGPSGKSGGDLGWFSSQQMVKPFSEAAAAMEKGKYSKEPVKTQFGWHVILLDDSRESSPPPFEQLKPQLQSFAQNERIQNYVQSLRDNATIDIADTFTKEASPAPAIETAEDQTQEETAESETSDQEETTESASSEEAPAEEETATQSE
ncbi:MAG: peptidylprolyl isomerase [Gammaproteobacteria bacterium]